MEQKLVIAADSYYLDSRGQVRGPLKDNNGSSWFEENTLNHWDAAGQPWPSNRDLVTLVEECFVVKHPQDDMPIIPLDNDRKGYMIELLTDYTADEFEFEDEVVYVISQSNVFRYMERLNRFLPMDRPQEFMEYMKRNGSESVHMLLASLRHIDEELAKVKGLQTREAFLQISDSAREFVKSMRDLNDSIREMGTRAHLKIKHIREAMDREEAFRKAGEEGRLNAAVVGAAFHASIIPEGTKIDFLEVPPANKYDEFVEGLLREIAKSMGVSYEEMSRDYELITGQESPIYLWENNRAVRLDRKVGLGSMFVVKMPPPDGRAMGLAGMFPDKLEGDIKFDSNPGPYADWAKEVLGQFPPIGIRRMKASDMPKWHADEPRMWSERWQRWIPKWSDSLMVDREEHGPRPKIRADGQRMRIVLKNLGVNNVKNIGGGMIDAMFLNYSGEVFNTVYWNELEQSFNDVLTDDPKGAEFARIWMPVKGMFSEDRLEHFPRPKVEHAYWHRNGNLYFVTGFNNEEHGRQDEYPTMVEYRNLMTGKKYSRKLIDWGRSLKEAHRYQMSKAQQRKLDEALQTRHLGHDPEFGVSLESESLGEPYLPKDRGLDWQEVRIEFRTDPENKRVVGVLAEGWNEFPKGTVMERNEDGTVQPVKPKVESIVIPKVESIVIPKVRLSFPTLAELGGKSESLKQTESRLHRPGQTKFAAKVVLDTRDPASKAFMEDIRKTAQERTMSARESMLAEAASKEIAERVLKGLLVTGFENDRDIERVLDDQRPLVENSIKRMLLDGEWKKRNAPDY